MSETRNPSDWNPRYVAYAAAHGRSPIAMLQHDEKRWPGGIMCGFTIWIGEKWAAWHTLRGVPRDDPKGPAEHADFDAWLGKG